MPWLGNRHPTGADWIFFLMVFYPLSDEISLQINEPFCSLSSRSFFPSQWKVSFVRFLLKGIHFVGYRHITNLSDFSPASERIPSAQLYSFVSTKNNALQFGSDRKRFAVLKLSISPDELSKHYVDYNSFHCLYLDIRKALGKHSFSFCLSDRWQWVKIDCSLDNFKSVIIRVHQGSGLGLLLIAIFINYLEEPYL